MAMPITFLLFTSFSYAQSESQIFYWYGEKGPEYWQTNEAVLAIKTYAPAVAQSRWQHPAVKETNLIKRGGGNILSIQLTAEATAADKEVLLAQAKQEDIHAKRLTTINKVDVAALANKDLFIDNQLLAGFKKAPTQTQLNTLQQEYGLTIQHRPMLENGTYIFTMNTSNLEVYARMVEEHPELVAYAQPNRVNMFEPFSQVTEDADIEKAWHVSGGQVSCSDHYDQPEADLKVAEVWNSGYTGQGIKVGVIDFHGFDFDHPDMQGQMLPGWDCIYNTSYDATNYHFVDAEQAHGMAVAGVVAAKANNGQGAAGVAYDSRVIPFLTSGSEASIILAMQKALEFEVDVLNCSFGSYNQSPAIHNEIKNLKNNGRNLWGQQYGTVVVASHGNDYYDDASYPQYPSAYEEVISVGASTPDDKRKAPGDGWDIGMTWGTNYGYNMHVAAPGVCIYTTDVSGADGYSSQDYIGFFQTSAAAPIVSGVVALLLSKNPQLTVEEVMDKVTGGAEKVHNGSLYNYNSSTDNPGRSQEMGYGRVNALNTVISTPVSVESLEGSMANGTFTIASPVSNQLQLSYKLPEQVQQAEMAIYNANGQLIHTQTLFREEEFLTIDVYDLSPGMYFSRFMNREDEIVQTVKFIKIW